MPVYFEHHILLWKHPTVRIGLKALKGALKRMFAGMQIFVTEASGQGIIAFSRDGAGHIVPIHLKQGERAARARAPVPRRHRHRRLQLRAGQGPGLHAVRPERLLHRQVPRPQGEGVLWLHGYGNVFEKVLAAGEQIDIEPGGWLYKDPQVRMETDRRPPDQRHLRRP